MAIRVSVKLFGALREQAGGEERTIELPAGATLGELLRACGLPDRVDIWALVDGQRAVRAQPLSDGAEVQLFQPVGGG